MTWTEPDMTKYAAPTKYRVEVKEGAREWREVGSISAKYKMRMEIIDVKSLDIQNVRVIAVNRAGESVPSSNSEWE